MNCAPDDRAAQAATGFLAAGPAVLLSVAGEGTAAELEQYRYDELDDMVSTVGSGLLGLTTACARCHDHKFDPIPTRDYYRLAAVFGTTDRRHLTAKAGEKSNRPIWNRSAPPVAAVALRQAAGSDYHFLVVTRRSAEQTRAGHAPDF